MQPWQPVDGAAFFRGDNPPVVPTGMAKTDGHCLLYPASTHSFHGESGVGKSWVVQVDVAACLMAGLTVLYLDYESSYKSVTGRLVNLGCTPADIIAGLVYVNPAHPPTRPEFDALLVGPFDRCVIDGVTKSMTISRFKGIDNDDVALWVASLPERIAVATGAATSMVDHVTKSTEGRGRYAIGGMMKLALVTGASYGIEEVRPIGRGRIGVLHLRVGKDREGLVEDGPGVQDTYRKSDDTYLAAVLTIDATDPEHIDTSLAGPTGAPDGGDFRPTELMERVSACLEAMTEPVSYRVISGGVSGRERGIRRAVDVLIREGYVDGSGKGKGGHPTHVSVRQYRQVADPASDRFQGRETVGPELITAASPN